MNMVIDRWTLFITVISIYAGVLSVCVARFAFSGKTKDDPRDFFDYTAMVLLSPFFIIHRSILWVYNNWQLIFTEYLPR